MTRLLLTTLAYLTAALTAAPFLRAADPWADNVVSYTAGEAINFATSVKEPLTEFIDPNSALGEPARRTSDDDPITVIVGADSETDVVSIGEGGHLTVSFDEPVLDDPDNPFGIDLLIFGNSFLFDFVFNSTTMMGESDGLFDGVFSEGGIVEVSNNGTDFVTVPVDEADGLFPTRGFVDDAATMPTDFTLPVNPDYNPIGDTLAEVNAAYGTSGGGLGIDLADVSLASITHVRITNPLVTDPGQTFSVTPEVDAIVDVAAVPEPTTLVLAAGSLALLLVRRK